MIAWSINPSSFTKSVSFRSEPVSETRCRYRFALHCFLVRWRTVQVGQATARGRAKRSSHPWHFRCWSPKRNELECTDLVPLDSGITPFSSRDAIIVVDSVLEKHFDGDFTPDQEKDITFKRWPPGYQAWKLSLALNGLKEIENVLVSYKSS